MEKENFLISSQQEEELYKFHEPTEGIPFRFACSKARSLFCQEDKAAVCLI